MILNSYAILVAFVAVLRLVLGLLIVGVGLRVWLETRGTAPIANRDAPGNRFYLLLLLNVLLLTLNIISWPLLYLVWQSYVAEFSGVMCIYGVLRVGEHSLGPARHLPAVVTFLQISKPILAFAGGAWLVLHVVNRRTATGPLLPKLVLLLLPMGVLAIVDAAADLAYVSISKTEDAPRSGCCTVERDGNRDLPAGITSTNARGGLTIACSAGTALLVAALGRLIHQSHPPGRAALGVLFLTAMAVTVLAGVFLVDVAAPALLRQPFHHCPYDLVTRVPEAIVAVALYVLASFSVGWAWVVRQIGSHAEIQGEANGMVLGLLRVGAWCYVASIGMLLIELALA